MNNGFLAWGNYLCPKWDFTFYLCAFSKKCEDWDANLYFFVSILWWPRKALLRPLTSNRLIEWWSQLLNSEIPHCICMSSIFSWAAPSQWLNISRILKFTHSWEMQNSSEWWLWHKDSLLVLLRFTRTAMWDFSYPSYLPSLFPPPSDLYYYLTALDPLLSLLISMYFSYRCFLQ